MPEPSSQDTAWHKALSKAHIRLFKVYRAATCGEGPVFALSGYQIYLPFLAIATPRPIAPKAQISGGIAEAMMEGRTLNTPWSWAK